MGSRLVIGTSGGEHAPIGAIVAATGEVELWACAPDVEAGPDVAAALAAWCIWVFAVRGEPCERVELEGDLDHAEPVPAPIGPGSDAAASHAPPAPTAPAPILDGPLRLRAALQRATDTAARLGLPPLPVGGECVHESAPGAGMLSALRARGGTLRLAPPPSGVEAIHVLGHLLALAPPPLLSIARAVEACGRGPATAIGELQALTTAAERALCTWLDDPTRAAAVGAALRGLVGEISGLAEARQGDPRPSDRALGWFERAIDEQLLVERLTSDDPWVRARYWLERGRAANHLGDGARAAVAARHAADAVREEQSLRGLLLAVEAENLAAVAAQTAWPFEPGDAAVAELRPAAHRLEAVVRKLDLVIGRSGEPWRLEPTLGAALGTLARCHAFLGEHERARGLLYQARGHFVAEIDRALNAWYLAQVELDAPRPDLRRLGAILDAVQPRAAWAPAVMIAALVAGDRGARFRVALALKAAARGLRLPQVDGGAWRDALTGAKARNVLASMPDHPTELIARYAGELLCGTPDSAVWFELGIALGRAGGPELRRMTRFTERLAAGYGPDNSAPRGSVLNPCYEHR